MNNSTKGLRVLLVALVVLGVVFAPGRAVGARTAPTPATPTVSGPCSKATALRVARNPFSTDVRKQFGQVLCGHFTGPGSDAMVVTFNAPTCWSPQGWAVYRRTGGVWRLVMSQPYVFLAAPLVVVGSDIKETRPVFRPGDNRCNPSGGTHARVWHWNGSHLVAGAWAQPPLVHLDSFLSPDRKIWCRIDHFENDAWCGTRTPESVATVKHSGAVTVCNAVSPGDCLQNWDDQATVLGYGHRSELNGFRCASAVNGITCTVIAGAGRGKGFRIKSSGVTKVGPNATPTVNLRAATTVEAAPVSKFEWFRTPSGNIQCYYAYPGRSTDV